MCRLAAGRAASRLYSPPMKDAILLVLAVVWTVGWASRAVVEVSNDRPWWSVYSAVLFVAGVGWVVTFLRLIAARATTGQRGCATPSPPPGLPPCGQSVLQPN